MKSLDVVSSVSSMKKRCQSVLDALLRIIVSEASSLAYLMWGSMLSFLALRSSTECVPNV